MTHAAPTILDLRNVRMVYEKPGAEPLEVLGGVELQVGRGEIVGLLGRSGSGKSTLLRIAAGLIKPTGGEVLYRGEPLAGPAAGIAVVFQTFALYPWLTVQRNVELGLDALQLPVEEVRRRALGRSTSSGSTASSQPTHASSRAACVSGWDSRAPSSAIRPCC